MMPSVPEFQGNISILVSVEQEARLLNQLGLISWSFLSC